jgi:hypothetical protein
MTKLSSDYQNYSIHLCLPNVRWTRLWYYLIMLPCMYNKNIYCLKLCKSQWTHGVSMKHNYMSSSKYLICNLHVSYIIIIIVMIYCKPTFIRSYFISRFLCGEMIRGDLFSWLSFRLKSCLSIMVFNTEKILYPPLCYVCSRRGLFLRIILGQRIKLIWDYILQQQDR